MVLGKYNGAIVPIVVRIGYATPGTLAVDDESSIATSAATGPIPIVAGKDDGGYIADDSNGKYTAMMITDTSR